MCSLSDSCLVYIVTITRGEKKKIQIVGQKAKENRLLIGMHRQL